MNTRITAPKSEEEYVDMIDTGLRNAVKSCMIADVPIGVFLSGGINSSLVTSYMAECSNMPVRTFSVGFGNYINELPYAQKVADMYKTEHTVINVSADVEKTIEEALWFYEEPFTDRPLYLRSSYPERRESMSRSYCQVKAAMSCLQGTTAIGCCLALFCSSGPRAQS